MQQSQKMQSWSAAFQNIIKNIIQYSLIITVSFVENATAENQDYAAFSVFPASAKSLSSKASL